MGAPDTAPEPDADTEPVWVGVDLGTQSVRVLALDPRGRALAAADAPLTSRRSGGTHEQDPHAWWRAGAAALSEVTGRLGAAAARVRGVAACGTSGTFTLVDGYGVARFDGVMYDDTRAAAEAAEVAETGARLWDELGYRMQPTWALPKLLKLVRDGRVPPGLRLAHQPDVLTARLTGGPVPTDTSSALKTGIDPRTARWPEPLLADLGIGTDLLPTAVLPGRRIGSVCREAAERTGLPTGTAVFSGMTDGCAAQLSAGALAVGDWNSVLGTTLVCKGVSAELIPDPHGAIYSHRSADGTWLPGGASSVGLGVLAELFADADLDALSHDAFGHRPPVCYPLRRPGERFPFLAADAHGFLLTDDGTELPIDAATRAALGDREMLGALLLGVAYTERLCYATLARAGHDVTGRIRFSGGGTRNPLLTRLRAEVLGRPVEVPELTEPAAGMAILAAWGGSPAGSARRLADVAGDMVTVGTVLDPGRGPRVLPERSLADGYARFCAALRSRDRLPDVPGSPEPDVLNTAS